ncbi:MAG: sigma 54-interacting transcriptional regulator [Negativicutes bacterium]|nr:sigma 54-interacting transcriptional regulator [Negativicutes bacterium]
MGKIIFYVPNLDDKNLVKEIFAEQYDDSWELELRYTTGVREILHEEFNADAVVARGITGEAARRILPDTPVIGLSVTGYDIMRAVIDCRQRFNATRIAVVGAPNMIYGANAIEGFLDVKMELFPIGDEEDAENKINSVMQDGITTIIGGGTAAKIAVARGLNAVMIQSGREAIHQALLEAKAIVAIRRQEQERAEQFRTILDFSLEGIIAVDETGNINLVNKAAGELTGIGGKSIGRSAAAIVPQLRLEQVLQTAKAELGLYDTIAGHQVAINCVPIIVKSRTVGAMATFQPVARLQEMEGKIRRKINRRRQAAKFSFEDIIAESPGMRRIVALAKEYSKVDSNVLILGETGAGKEVVAQSLHNASSRRHGPWVPVNCAALPESLLESELFGYVEGAFTGAAKGGKTGLFEQAHRGTIFLDEIAEISPKLQGQLLRVLQEREIMRVGDEQVIPIDVRVLAATNRNLRQRVSDGFFRADLYYRLDILNLEIPPLRDRKEDILPLVRQFMKHYALRFQKGEKILTPEAHEWLINYPWPGNVRELLNITERLTVLDGYIHTAVDENIVRSVLAHFERPEAAPSQASLQAEPVMKKKQLAQMDKIKKVLEETNYNYGKTAELMGISRTTLWRRLGGKDTK